MARRTKGEGTFFFDNTNKCYFWRGIYTTPSGEKKTKSFRSKKQIDLKKKVDAFLLELESNKFIATNISLNKWVDQWLEIIVKPTVKISTYNIYKQKLKYVTDAFGERKLPTLTTLEIQSFFNNLHCFGGAKNQGLSPATVNNVRRYFKSCCNDAVKNGYLKFNPVEGTKPQRKLKKEIVVMDESDVIRFLTIAEKGDYIYQGISNPKLLTHNRGTDYYIKTYFNLVNLALATGMRISELRGLSWSNVNFSKSYINIKEQLIQTNENDVFDEPKTEKSKRKILVGKNIINTLKEFKKYQQDYSDYAGDFYNNKYNLVFTNTVGNPINLTNFRKRYFSKMLAAANIPEKFTIHSMRHTHASILLKNKVNALVVSERLGHSSVTVTLNIYAHVLKSMETTASTAWDNIVFNNGQTE
ncbi:MAG: tyrosine-type recombinase/integrase [Parabacteroides sp.]|nr:tyrosine-type recombinase/integrase [Parabacteroides sp.]